MSLPEVSVIMGIYNCEKYLEEAIDSIMAQTFTDWNMIMCDDASTDNTYNIAKKYADKYPDKFILIKNDTNMGLNTTLNNCLKYAKGKYIARMDGDDISYPTRFYEEVSFLNENLQYSIVSCQMEYFDENGVFRVSNMKKEPVCNDLVYGTPFCHAPCMVRREAYDAVNGYSVSKWLLRAEDYHLWIKMYRNGFLGYNLDKALYKMRDDRNSVKRRKYIYRINEAYVICCAVKYLKLPVWKFVYALKPLIVGMLPLCIYNLLHRH